MIFRSNGGLGKVDKFEVYMKIRQLLKRGDKQKVFLLLPHFKYLSDRPVNFLAFLNIN